MLWSGSDRDSERGSATMLGLAVIFVVIALGVAATAFGQAASANAQASTAADLAALAAAGRALEGSGCPAAESVAAANRARLLNCRISGLDATVAVEVEGRGLLAAVAAAAGRPSPWFRGDARAGPQLE